MSIISTRVARKIIQKSVYSTDILFNIILTISIFKLNMRRAAGLFAINMREYFSQRTCSYYSVYYINQMFTVNNVLVNKLSVRQTKLVTGSQYILASWLCVLLCLRVFPAL